MVAEALAIAGVSAADVEQVTTMRGRFEPDYVYLSMPRTLKNKVKKLFGKRAKKCYSFTRMIEKH